MTGWGKTVIAVNGLLPLWRYSVTLDAKGGDSELNAAGERFKRWPKMMFHAPEKLLITPRYSDSMLAFAETFENIWKTSKGPRSGWTVYIDELRPLTDSQAYATGRFRGAIERIWLQGRSKGITLIAGTQAPRWVPSAFYEQPRRFLISGFRDTRAIKRLAEISGDVDAIQATVPALEEAQHEFLYVGPEGLHVTRLERRIA